MEMTYEEFINNILETRGRFECGDEYHERHHIVPKCMGGTNDEENLIDLFAREHFEAHRLLALENPENEKLVYAWNIMAFTKNDAEDRYLLTAEEYDEVRTAVSKAKSGENNHFYGKHHSKETKEKISKSNKGKKMSKESREKLSQSCMGRKAWNKGMPGKYGKDNPNYGNHKLAGKNHPRIKKINQYDINMNFIKTWDYIKQASDELHINYTCLIQCCRGDHKTAGGFIWKYVDN